MRDGLLAPLLSGGGRPPSSFIVVFVELLEDVLDVCKLLLGLLDDLAQVLLSLLFCNVLCACIVLQLAVMLDLLARVLDFGEAERGGRALEEMAELTKLLEVLALFLFSVSCVSRGTVRRGGCAVRGRAERGRKCGVTMKARGGRALTAPCPSS